MSQSATVVGLLAVAFILYVAARGRLPTYTAVLWGPAPKAASGGSSGSSSGGGFTDAIAKAVPTVIQAVALAG